MRHLRSGDQHKSSSPLPKSSQPDDSDSRQRQRRLKNKVLGEYTRVIRRTDDTLIPGMNPGERTHMVATKSTMPWDPRRQQIADETKRSRSPRYIQGSYRSLASRSRSLSPTQSRRSPTGMYRAFDLQASRSDDMHGMVSGSIDESLGNFSVEETAKQRAQAWWFQNVENDLANQYDKIQQSEDALSIRAEEIEWEKWHLKGIFHTLTRTLAFRFSQIQQLVAAWHRWHRRPPPARALFPHFVRL